jgi:insulysin
LVECLITDALTEYSYDASLAGLNYSLAFDEDGNLILQTGGYTDKMLALLQHLLETARSHQVREDRLKVFKEEVGDSQTCIAPILTQ